MSEPRSDARGDDADIHPYPGQDRPADPGVESMAAPDDGVEMASPSEMAGAADNARADDVSTDRHALDDSEPS